MVIIDIFLRNTQTKTWILFDECITLICEDAEFKFGLISHIFFVECQNSSTVEKLFLAPIATQNAYANGLWTKCTIKQL